MNVLALCSGAGGLELGIKFAVPAATCVCYVEREAYPAAVLVERMAVLGVAPIWSDVATFDGEPWRGVVDCVTAGYPCQPESFAGHRLGDADERWIWSDIARILRDVQPAFVFLENVAAHLAGTFGRVLGDLAAFGLHVEWDCVPAATVGATHVRDRLFVLAAHPDRIRAQAWIQAAAPGDRWAQERDTAATLAAGAVPRGAPQPLVHRVDDGVANWVDRTRACGNGVVPNAAAQAWRMLSRRLAA